VTVGIAKRELYRLIEALPDKDVPAAKKYLETLVHRDRDAEARKAFASAPIDDEPLTEEDRKAITEARADITNGRFEILEPRPSIGSRTRRRP